MTKSTKKLTTSAMVCSIAFLLMLISNFIPDVAGFLQFDVKDVAITIGGYVLGPVYALGITIVVAFLELITVSHTGPIGLIMNIASTVSFCFVASYIYSRKRTLKNAILGLVAGTLTMTAVMILWNYAITPLYMKIPRDAVVTMLPTVFLPFNLVKGFLNAGIILLSYNPIVYALRKTHLIPESKSGEKKKFTLAQGIGIALIIVFIPVFLSLAGII